ncbi:splicing factor, arginine/serine-rich 19 [Thalassophryne amazonica]|uniref:splicing factor, arginine/serine-rich 19 n=1 Tax=Thalassophryne amazonica TaxID=390379 RepID=UPI001471546F|nr:splicing factor, arginine/serine-rich 19 [Thalassophryne amazonica]XP_034045487.1 splicing factor, arginine/serine-rich 19 [Thalassophryne amazonica]XP_034045488.1 splicing factor, arginine/serine-rich 19 [Thalassophryne amazonica]
MDLDPASSFERRSTPDPSLSQAIDIARSPRPCSPSLSPLLPSSDPSSPLSTSSSCPKLTDYCNHVKGSSQAPETARVSSTSSLNAQSVFLPTLTVPSESVLFTTRLPGVDVPTNNMEKEMYDPFHPTEGDRESRVEEQQGEKYDPFNPTGSPASDVGDGSGKAKGLKKSVDRNEEDKVEEPPDSTDALPVMPSPSLTTQLHLRRRVDCCRDQRESVHSDFSEIEEGEIVGAADRDGSKKRTTGENINLNSPSVSVFGLKPERILRVLDGDSFVSVRAEGTWDEHGQPQNEPVVGVEDLRRKLVSRRKERYLTFPASSPLSPQSPRSSPHPPLSAPSSPLVPPAEQSSKNHKSSKNSKDADKHKSKDRSTGDEKRKKRRKDKEEGREKGKDKDRARKSMKEAKRRSSRSSSQKRKKRQHSSPEALRSHISGRNMHSRYSFSGLSHESYQEREQNRDRDRNRVRERERDRDRYEGHTRRRRRDGRRGESSSRNKDREWKERRHSSSTERGNSKRSKRSREKRTGNRDRQRDKEQQRRRDGRPVVPPSIQDLNGSDLFAIKRTITVTTTTTTTTLPGSPIHAPTSPCRPTQESDKPHKRKKKRKWHTGGKKNEGGNCRSRSQSLSPTAYHCYESDRYSDKLDIDMLSLDGEALDSDYPSLEDTPPAPLLPEPPLPSLDSKTAPKSGGQHSKTTSSMRQKVDQLESSSSSSSHRTKSKSLSLSGTSVSSPISSSLSSSKRARKQAKDKDRDKSFRKDSGRSGKTKKDSVGSRKGKLQSKVSVLLRDGVSSTTGASVGSGKMGMELLGSGGTGGSAGASVVGGSIAVVFCRDNESRSPFLKPCSEPLSLGSRSKDLASLGKRSNLAAPPSLSSPAGLKAKKAKPSSITSTSSSASSPTSSLLTKRRRRLGRKVREKGGTVGMITSDVGQSMVTSEGWDGASTEVLSAVGNGTKSITPHTGPTCPTSSSSSSSTSSASALPPSSSPPHTPPPCMPSLRDTRESSPDSQTVDSSCKTPEASFLVEDCPTQTSPTMPLSSPSSLSTPHGTSLTTALSTPPSKPLPLDDIPKSLASPPCPSSSAGCGLASLSMSLSSSDPSSSSVSSSSSTKPPPPPPPPAASALPWSLQTGVDCTTGGVLALTALLFKMEEANIASRAKAQEFIQATSQILSQANQNQSQQHTPPSLVSSKIPPPSLPPPPGLSPAQFILHGSLPLVGCSKTPPSQLHPSIGGGSAQTPPPVMPVGLSRLTGTSGDTGWDSESKDPDKYLKKLHTQERAVEEVKLAIKPYYQRKDINKDEYKDILRKAVHKICHSRTGEINPVKVSNLVKLYVQRYKYFRKHGRRMDDEDKEDREPGALHSSA